MKFKFIQTITLVILTSVFFSCKESKEVSSPKADAQNQEMSFDIPKIIYKTNKDYSNNVFIILNDDKTEIISYPHPNDLKSKMPIKLNSGYFLDKKGISKNSVFTSFTLEKYTQLSEPPTTNDLMSSIIDKDPFVEFHVCSNKLSTNEINEMIDKNKIDCK